jgi:hypothetical protein
MSIGYSSLGVNLQRSWPVLGIVYAYNYGITATVRLEPAASPDPPPITSIGCDLRHRRLILNATRGSFRFSTGAQGSKSYQVKTPYGTLGVRG